MGIFQILWIYYGLLIGSWPVIMWNFIAVLVNFFSVGAIDTSHLRKAISSGNDGPVTIDSMRCSSWAAK
jgi:hypothetical protein